MGGAIGLCRRGVGGERHGYRKARSHQSHDGFTRGYRFQCRTGGYGWRRRGNVSVGTLRPQRPGTRSWTSQWRSRHRRLPGYGSLRVCTGTGTPLYRRRPGPVLSRWRFFSFAACGHQLGDCQCDCPRVSRSPDRVVGLRRCCRGERRAGCGAKALRIRRIVGQRSWVVPGPGSLPLPLSIQRCGYCQMGHV